MNQSSSGLTKYELRLRDSLCGAVVLLAIVATWSRIGLFADGALAFQRMVVSHRAAVDPMRSWAGLLMQAPIVTGLRLGIDDGLALQRLLTAGLVWPTALAWVVALRLHRRSRLFWLLGVTWGTVYLNTGLFALSEFNLTYALIATCTAILTAPDGVSPARATGFLVIAIVLLRSYESVAILGPLMAALAALAALDSVRQRASGAHRTTWILIVAGLIMLGATTLATLSVRAQYPGTIGQALDISTLAASPQLVLSFIAAGSIFVGAGILSGRASSLAYGVAAVAVGLLVASRGWSTPWQHYNQRIAVSAPLAVLAVLAGWWRYGTSGGKTAASGAAGTIPRSGVFASALLIAVLWGAFAWHLVGFTTFLRRVENVIDTGSGAVPWENVKPIDEAYLWPWAVPVLSLALQEPPACALILPPESHRGWQPFDPTGPVPDSLGGTAASCP